MDAAARADPRVKQATASLGSEDDRPHRDTPGFAGDVRPLTRLNVTVIVGENGKRDGLLRRRGRVASTSFLEEDWRASLPRQSGRRRSAHAVEAPAGEMTVVLGPLAGHPVTRPGHGPEGDFNRKETSAFSRRMARRSPELVTV
jgi:TldD protein